ncbi:MAG: CHAD domain-containing protein [Anaerolineae bacterium]|nr:CHAD domain-containing protein [Anaerolineae bacterium]
MVVNSNAAEQAQILTSSSDKVLPIDTLAEAGRKILLAEYSKIHQFEVKADTDENRPNVNEMRVTVYHIQGALKLLKPQYAPKNIRFYRRTLNDLSQILSAIRYIDELIEDLGAFGSSLESNQQDVLKSILDKLAKRRNDELKKLDMMSNNKKERRFIKSLVNLGNTPVNDPALSGHVEPSQVRYLLPKLIYERLAVIRAYNEALVDVNIILLDELRVEVSRLLYTVSIFEEVLGKQITGFTEELRLIQDTLDQIHDMATTQNRLDRLMDTSKKKYLEIFETYLNHRKEKEQSLIAAFKEQWIRFNSRKVQQKLSTALLTLYEN